MTFLAAHATTLQSTIKMAAIVLVLVSTGFASVVDAGGSRRTTIDWVDISEAEDIVRVKLKDGMSTPAPCQEKVYVVFRLSNPQAKTYLAAIYMAAGDPSSRIRLYGSDQCDIEAGAESVVRVRMIPGSRS